MVKRSSFLKYDEYLELGVKPVRVWAYGKTGRFVCPVEINAAGVALYAGKKGRKRLADVSWERLVERLGKKKKG